MVLGIVKDREVAGGGSEGCEMILRMVRDCEMAGGTEGAVRLF